MARVVVPISLPKDLNLKIEKQIKKRGYASKSEYFRDLARESLDRLELEEERKKYPKFYAKLDRELKKGLKAIDKGEYSGPFTAKEARKFLASIGNVKTKK
jgi:Arc/MetJ-type ribon-helix-helix transcriptional regulator